MKLTVFGFLFLVSLWGCTPPTQCSTADGTPLDVSTPFGVWKKVSGYNPVRTETELTLNYDVLIVEPGNRICMSRIVNGASQSMVFRGTYEHDVNLKRMEITYEDSTTDGATYSLTGGCTAPGMSIRYDNSDLEGFTLSSKSLDGVTCAVQNDGSAQN